MKTIDIEQDVNCVDPIETQNTNPSPVEGEGLVDETNSQNIVKTDKVNKSFSVRERLEKLKLWQVRFRELDKILENRERALNPKSPCDRQIGASIARQRRRLRILLSQLPLEIVTDEMDGEELAQLRANLFIQFAALSPEEKLLWLNNFEFILTPDLNKLYAKLERIRAYRSLGQQRGLLIGGPSGMGKTSALNALTMLYEPEITDEVTVVPIIKIDAPANNRSSRTLFRRILNALGLTFSSTESEDELFDTALAFLDACQVELIIIDEIEHMKQREHRRQLLDLSNQTRGIPIICASCNPVVWTEGDPEIAGRWNDLFIIEPYTPERLAALLTYLEILIPFSSPSNLDEFWIQKEGDTKEEGPATFIYNATKGVLRDVMILVRDACRYAIEKELSCIDMQVLQIVWKQIQEKPNPRNDEKEID